MARTVEQIRSDAAGSPGEDPAVVAVGENLPDRYGPDSVHVSVHVVFPLDRRRRGHGVQGDVGGLAEQPATEAWAPPLGTS